MVCVLDVRKQYIVISLTAKYHISYADCACSARGIKLYTDKLTSIFPGSECLGWGAGCPVPIEAAHPGEEELCLKQPTAVAGNIFH